jgi:3'(2'), 5'-bisphosphate nucleotidase
MAYEKELEVAIAAVYAASEKILTIYNKDFDVDYKADDSPITRADIDANTAIHKIISRAFPYDGFVSEETVDDGSRMVKERFWVIDPLDGTKEFIKKNGEFTVNIALVDGDEVVIGVIFAPVSQTLYYGVKGSGAFCKDQDGIKPLQVSKRVNPIRVLVSRSHPADKTFDLIQQMKSKIECVEKMGSSLKGCLIAAGAYDVYYNFGRSMKWDTCAMTCIVEEAGGIIRQLDGKPIDYTEKNKVNHGFYILNCIENAFKDQELSLKA